MTKPEGRQYYNASMFAAAEPVDEQESANVPSLRDVFVGIDTAVVGPGVNQTASGGQPKSSFYQHNRSSYRNDDLSDQEENDQFWNKTIRLASVNTGQFMRKKTLSRKTLPFVDTGKKTRLEYISRALRKYYRQYKALLICMAISVIAAFACYHIGPHIRSHTNLWIPVAVPGVTIALYLLCHAVETILLNAIGFPVISPPWIVTIITQSSKIWFRYFLLFGFLSIYLTSWWEMYNGPSIISPEFLGSAIRSIFDVILLVMVRNVFLKLLERRLAWVSFGKEAEGLYFIERFVFDVLCYQDPAMPSDIFSRCFSEVLRTNFVTKLEWLKDSPLSLPLEQTKSEQWKFSQESRVEVVSRREVEFMADEIYHQILIQHNVNSITFDTWGLIFHQNKKAAKKAFRLLFSSDPAFESKSQIDREDFKTAFFRVYRARSVLTNKLTNFSNIYTLINTAACSLFWICMVFFVAHIFGYHFKELIVLLSTIIFSFSFAMSKSISRVVECAIFVFGSRPFTVNDTVIIDNQRFVVKQISLLETRLQDMTNKIVRISNQKLLDSDFINLSYSTDNAISLIETELSITTPVDSIERLRASILTYTRRHQEHWKPRISILMNEIKQANSFRLLMYVESKIPWPDRTAFREADLELKRHVCQKMLKLGICYRQPKQQVEVMASDSGDFVYASQNGVSIR